MHVLIVAYVKQYRHTVPGIMNNKQSISKGWVVGVQLFVSRATFTQAAIREIDAQEGGAWAGAHQRAAGRLLQLCRVNGGAYVKVMKS